MNFFKKRNRHTVVSVLDHTNEHDTESNKLRRSSGGLKRSGGISLGNGYHDSETRRFEEPLLSDPQSTSLTHATSDHLSLPADNVPQSEARRPRVTIATSSESFDALNHHTNNNNTYNLFMEYNSRDPVSSATEVAEDRNAVEECDDSGSNLPADKKAKELMILYASIIRGEKSNVKKQLTAYRELVEAPDNLGRTPLMYCVLADRLDCAKLLLKMKCKLDQVDKAGRSALHLAAHKASYKFLELLHDRGGNIEMKDNDGQTPLHLTTRNHHARCLDFLLKRLNPGMAEVTDNQNRTALHWSAAFNNAECVKLLIKYKCNTAISDAEGKTPLHWAANTHDPTAVATMKALLDSSPSALNWQDYEGRTALHFAVAHENVAVVEYLLNFEQQKCELDRLDNTFRTPLHWAAQLGNTTIVKLLLSVGAKNSISDGHGATPLLYAALYDKPEVVAEMINHDQSILDQADIEGRSALMWSAGKGANDVIQMLLKFNQSNAENTTDKLHYTSSSIKIMVDVNRTDNKGNTALHMAAWNGSARSADLLLTHNARHDLQNNMNHTPLFGACEKGHLNVVKHLLDSNASIFLRDIEERTPLHWAALGGHAEICDLLIKKGLDPDVRDAFQRSPLHCAAFGGFINCMNLLLETKANVDLQDREGMSALHWAAQSGHLDASKLLFQCSAFPNLMEFTEERLTPLDHALLNSRDEVAQYLIEQGALSSETIRDIAAARIQACYRGYQVRKAFLNRKNLLMKHERLRNKSKKHRNRKTLPYPLSDNLGHVAEEPVPKSPNTESIIAESFYSGDESRADTQDEPTAKVMSIQSPGNLVAVSSSICIGNALSETADDEATDYMVGVKQEDPINCSLPMSSSLSKTVNLPSPQKTGECSVTVTSQQLENNAEKDTLTHENETESSHNKEGQVDAEKSAALGDVNSKLIFADSVVDNDHNSSDIHSNSCGSAASDKKPESGDASSNDESRMRVKKKKRKTRGSAIIDSSPAIAASNQTLTESGKDEETSTAEQPRQNQQTRSRKSTLSITDRSCSSSASTENHECVTLYNNHHSEISLQHNNFDSQLQRSLQKLNDETNLKSRIERDTDSSRNSFQRQTLNDGDNVGSDENIAVDTVSGLAYNSMGADEDVFMPSLLDTDALNSSYFSSDLSLSEYIESLMSLSVSERKILVMLQRNRKHAFKMANSAAKILQAAWRRYLKKNFPNRDFSRSNEESDMNCGPTENDLRVDSRSSSLKNSLLKSTGSSTPSVSRLQSAKSTGSRIATSRPPSITQVRNVTCSSSDILPPAFKLQSAKNSTKSKKTISNPISLQQTQYSAGSTLQNRERSALLKKKRPQTSKKKPISCVDNISQDYSMFDNANESNDFVHTSVTSDATSATQSIKSKKIRPKTIDGSRRKHSLASTQDALVNKKVKQLCKVYGQTMMLQEMYNPERKSTATRSRFQTVTAPSRRPKTSKASFSIDYDHFEFDALQYQDSVAAVENSPEWKSSSAKRTESLSSNPTLVTNTKRKSFRRNRRVDDSNAMYLPLQWQKMYGDYKMSSLLNPNQRSSRTRFSYNMRSANF